MSKNPSTTFYFNDWENDAELKTCSLAAQGLWMRLLCIAARSPEPGIVQTGTFDMSPPHGLTHIVSAVGQPPDVITPLIDELLTSGAASRDRKGRIYCRRMVRAAGLSPKRAEAGKLGAEATHGKERRKEPLPGKPVGKPPGKPPSLQDSKTSNPLLMTSDGVSAARATASPRGPPRPRLPDTAEWAERLRGYEPWAGKRTWKPFWGLPPDSAGRNPMIPPELVRAWQAVYAEQMAARAHGSPAADGRTAKLPD